MCFIPFMLVVFFSLILCSDGLIQPIIANLLAQPTGIEPAEGDLGSGLVYSLCNVHRIVAQC